MTEIKNFISISRMKKYRAFSLMELMIGILIFLSCILLIIGLFPTSMKAVTKGRMVMCATQLASKKMEFIKSLTYDQIRQDNPAFSTTITIVENQLNGIVSHDEFTEQVVVSSMRDDLKSVRVQVSWQEGNRVRYVVLETLVADYR